MKLRVMILVLGAMSGTSYAHSGATDKDGCHMDRGKRHCHRHGERRPETGSSSGIATVIDGDSIKVGGIEMRLHGIDAIEGQQDCRRSNGERWNCGEQARLALRERVARQTLTCQHHGHDSYGRTLATCALPGGEVLNEWLVREGWAVAYRRYSTRYVPAEAEAKAAKRNIWSGTFVQPERYRRSK